MINKRSTDCCALCQLSGVGNHTTKEELQTRLAVLKKQKLANVDVGITYGTGQTSVFIITTPNEDQLRRTLTGIGFKNVHTFERRVGYPDGLLDMYIKNL